MQLNGNHILITGGSSGIGAALAEAFHQRGNTVGICGRRVRRLEQMQARLPGLKTLACDISRNEGRRTLLVWAQREMPQLNVLVNNAGIQRDIDFTGGLDQYLDGDSEIATNLQSPIELTGLFAPLLRRNANPAFINISSGLGFVPACAMPVYSATKAAMHAFSMAMRAQFEKVGVKVYEVIPPAVDTELNAAGRAQRGNFRANLSAEEFVAGVMKGLADDVPEIAYGNSLKFITASRRELDEIFKAMNKGW
jgi:uncharacterized oxidoreductase